jgi:ABC-type glycerol-3-phosphate transport system substrate-binding protein
MSGRSVKQLLLGIGSSVFLASSLFTAYAADTATARKTNINLAVASNFYGLPPSNSAITDLIVAFEKANPKYTVTVVDNGATATLADHIISGNKLGVDLFLAADTVTPFDLLTNHFKTVTTYNNFFCAAVVYFQLCPRSSCPIE